jgi:hypothetical protein
VIKNRCEFKAPPPFWWKTFKIFGNLGKFCAAISPHMYLVFFSDFQKICLHFRTRFCRLRFVIWFFLNHEFHKFIKLLRWMKTRKGLTFLCYKNELGHKQLLLIVFGIRNYRLPISFDSWLQKWRENFLARFINPVRSKYKKPALFNQRYILLFYAVKNGLKTSKDNSFKSSFTKPNFWIQTFAIN